MPEEEIDSTNDLQSINEEGNKREGEQIKEQLPLKNTTGSCTIQEYEIMKVSHRIFIKYTIDIVNVFILKYRQS